MSEAIETLRTATMYSNGSIAMSDRWADDVVAAYDDLEAVAKMLAEALRILGWSKSESGMYVCEACGVTSDGRKVDHRDGCDWAVALEAWEEIKENGS